MAGGVARAVLAGHRPRRAGPGASRPGARGATPSAAGDAGGRLFPSNFTLLYAAALLYGNDVLPHLLHALAGLGVALALVVAAPRWFDRRVGWVAALRLGLGTETQGVLMAPLFGYWVWDRADLGAQIASLRTERGAPAWVLWPAFAAGAWWRGSSGLYRALCATGYAALLLWAITSGYPRYLMPAYPLLALMAGSVLVRAADRLRGLPLAASITPPAATALRVVVVLVVAGWSVIEVRRSAALIGPTAAARDAVLGRVLDGYDLFRAVPGDRLWRLYQFGFEGELYYAPVPVVGDWFGPHAIAACWTSPPTRRRSPPGCAPRV